MIRDVKFDESPIEAGKRRALQAWSDKDLSVAIRCFTKDPPPPDYKSCPACGVIRAQSGEIVYIVADENVFLEPGGRVEVVVRDESGDERQFRLTVRALARKANPTAAAF